jgi:DNA-binding SARP family transcriptional activator
MQATLLGKFSFSKQDHRVGFGELQDSLKLQELLAYLLMHTDRPVAREELSEAVWNERPAPQAYAYAGRALTLLNTILGQEHLSLLYEAGRVQWDQTLDLQVDVHQFEAILAEASTSLEEPVQPQCLVRLFAGADLYRGPFLDGFYNPWCSEIRSRLEQKFLQFLEILMNVCKKLKDYDRGIDYGLRAVRLEPSRESTHRGLMQLFYLAGDRTSALRQYQHCKDALAEDLNTQPGEKTVNLYRQFQGGGQLPFSPTGDLPSSFHKALTNLHHLDQAVNSLHAQQVQSLASIPSSTQST